MKIRIFSLAVAVLFICLCGCRGQRTESISKAQEFMPKKTMTAVSWDKNDKLIVMSHFGATPGAISIHPHTDWLNLFGLAGMATAAAIKSDSERKFLDGTADHLKNEDYQAKFRRQLEEKLKNRVPGEVIMASRDLKNKESWKPTDKVLVTHFIFMFADNPARMIAQLGWNFADGWDKFQSLQKRMQEMAGSTKSMGEYQKFDGFGNYFYHSTPRSREEWQANNGQLIKEELDKAMARLAEELSQNFSGKGKI